MSSKPKSWSAGADSLILDPHLSDGERHIARPSVEQPTLRQGAPCYHAFMVKRLEAFDAVAFGPGPRGIVIAAERRTKSPGSRAGPHKSCSCSDAGRLRRWRSCSGCWSGPVFSPGWAGDRTSIWSNLYAQQKSRQNHRIHQRGRQNGPNQSMMIQGPQCSTSRRLRRADALKGRRPAAKDGSKRGPAAVAAALGVLAGFGD
jgi:hypothetical protein